MTHYQAPKGVFDILPQDPQEPVSLYATSLWQQVEQAAKRIAKAYNCQEIRTPIFEHTEVFTRSSGESSDIVSKEMYTFMDKGDRSLTLRPEGTAAVARAYVEHQLHRKKGANKLFYIGPYFRYDRPQAGRYRQFHQLGVEVFGIKDPELDVEMMAMLMDFYRELKLQDLTVLINSIGDQTSRHAYKAALVEYLMPLKDQLSKDSQQRLEKNPLRILDSKDLSDRRLLENAPKMKDFLNESSQDHFHRVISGLEGLKIPYVISDQLVRGLDYYNHTVFEVIASTGNAQNTIGAGGRYDGLLHQLNGPDLPSVGFATGIERTILTMIEQNVAQVKKEGIDLYFIPLNDEGKKICMQLIHSARQLNLSADMNHTTYKIQKSLQQAYSENARYAVIIGEEELVKACVKIKDLLSKEETVCPLKNFDRFCADTAQG
jgi:histidyl-tRNA synthetase